MKPLYHYAALVESSDDAIVAKDLDSRVMSWNPAAERIFGYSAEEMIGRAGGNIRIIHPLRDGVIVDYEMAQIMIQPMKEDQNTAVTMPLGTEVAAFLVSSEVWAEAS